MLSNSSKNSPRCRTARYIVVDIETSGLFPQRGARIIEIGAVVIEQEKVVEEFTSLINCGVKVPKHIQKIHGITDEMLKGQPSPAGVFLEFLRLMAAGTLVAHNLKFERHFLRYELSRLGIGFTGNGICTLKMGKKLFPYLPNYRLETVARYLLGELPAGLRLHRALDDARLTAMVWMEMERR
ncbi:MAG TPA: 3'-5' exonuclease [Thermodesulfobacteriota bacterium]|nr:3'-5' exonuclease [Thermodesulfobacteriota bacterium]